MRILQFGTFFSFSLFSFSLAALSASLTVSAADAPRWGSPKMSNNMILQVQYQQPAVPQIPVPETRPMTDAQRDTIFKELRPQSITPSAGATNTPSSVVPSAVEITPAPPLVNQKRDSYISDSQADKSIVDEVVNPQGTKSGTTAAPVPSAKNNSEPLLPNSNSRKTLLPSSNYYDYSVTKSKEIECPKNMDLKSIKEISCDIRPASDELPRECPLQAIPYTGRHFAQTCYQWKASALCTKAAYFEDVQLERYGHSVCPVFEPVISGAKFFLTVPFLPYKAGLIPPNECVYTLGHYRAGNCSPYMLDPLPISVRAILFEGAAVSGAVALLP